MHNDVCTSLGVDEIIKAEQVFKKGQRAAPVRLKTSAAQSSPSQGCKVTGLFEILFYLTIFSNFSKFIFYPKINYYFKLIVVLFFSVVLIAATVGLIQFRTYSVGLDFGLFQIEITILFLLVVHLITNREIIKVIIKKLGMGDVEQTESTLIDDDVINTYLAKYSTKTTKELEDIINSGDYSREATEAARKLMTK